MGRKRLAYTPGEIGRIQGTDPPVLAEDFMGDTQVAPPWWHQPHDAYCEPMRHHIIAGVFRGDGTTAVQIGGKRLHAHSEAGTVIINPRGHDGWWNCTGTPLVSNVFLGQERLQDCADEVGGVGTPELAPDLKIHDPRLFKILALIAEESTVSDEISKLYMEQLIDLLCLQLLRSHSTFPVARVGHRGGLSPRQVRSVTDYMRDHLSEDVGLQALADLVRLSRFHFCRAFRHTTGHTPHQYLMRLRIEKARQLLADPRLSVTDVALAVGYQTPSAFTQAFRSVLGVTPTVYRRRL